MWVSNIPQAIAPSADLAGDRWGPARLARLWGVVVVACGIAAGLGYLVADATSAATGSWMAAIAAGGLFAMLTDSLIPFAYERGKDLAGAATVLGFCLSLGARERRRPPRIAPSNIPLGGFGSATRWRMLAITDHTGSEEPSP